MENQEKKEIKYFDIRFKDKTDWELKVLYMNLCSKGRRAGVSGYRNLVINELLLRNVVFASDDFDIEG